MRPLLKRMPHRLAVHHLLPLVHRFRRPLDDENTTIIEDDVALHLSMPAATRHGEDAPGIQRRDDVMNAVVDALHAPIKWHAHLIP